MMAKMYYSEPETCEILGLDVDGLMEHVNTGRLQMYQDGPKHVYKASDVDNLKDELGPVSDDDDISLAETVITESYVEPQDESISLADVDLELDAPAEIRKEDTVITAAGISIFDDEDLEIEEADPMAATQIAPSLDDQVALDGIGSGSGLLDLTRESDDTSLGVEVLDHIDMEGGSGLSGGFGVGSGLSGEFGSADTGLSGGFAADTGLSGGFGADTGLSGGFGTADAGLSGGFGTEFESDLDAPMNHSVAPAPVMTEPPVFVEPVDGSTGFFTGLLVAASLVGFVIIATVISGILNIQSQVVQTLTQKIMILVGGGAAITIIGGVVGLLIGKSILKKREMLERFGG